MTPLAEPAHSTPSASRPPPALLAPALVAALVLCAAGLWAAAAAAQPSIGDGRGGVKLKQIGEFEFPVYVDDAPGFKRLLFVVEQPGMISVLRGSRVLAHRFLDIRDLVQYGGEQGLLSVAFPRDYEQSGRFYVYYTNEDGDNQVDEFRRSGGSATRADPASRRTVIVFSHPAFSNHNGGQLQFGPDGNLYIGTGDGGGGGDPFENAQNTDSLLGKLLRIDPRATGSAAYSIPAGNPFVGEPGADEVFSFGLRNPWRFSFERKTDRIAIGDVGQNAWEEIDYEPRSVANGANFGWDDFEGNHPFESQQPPPGYQGPIHEYPTASGCAVTGGYVVRDRKLDSLHGRYLYGDFCNGELRSFIPRLEGAENDRALGSNVPSLSSFGEGRRGRIYATSLDGPVFRLAPKG